MNIILGVVIGIIVLVVVGVAVAVISEKTALRYETMRDVAKVVRKEEDDNFVLQIATKTYPLGLWDEYNVYLSYKGEEHCIDDEDLYEKVKVGDTVRILVHKGYNKNGELKRTYISCED